MKILVTCGPSYEPIDQARRLTNFSTGKLGVTLANYFAGAGHDVICLKGEGATHPGRCDAGRIEAFATNQDLAKLLERLSQHENIHAVFHAAALCDYRVEQALNDAGEAIQSAKIATRDGRLRLVLAPAMKVLPLLRGWFPNARITGWKYELAGTRDEAFAKAWRQIQECGTDACVLNGAAYGEGFALCAAGGPMVPCPDAMTLCSSLSAWLQGKT